ncbi:hypothetical protein ACTU6V_06340 [Microbacterium sp. A204]|uniref:hypothetical protein n=1 Tax=Microbacterium sp. A204 TaxID=3457321 RepID=UPI003FD69849
MSWAQKREWEEGGDAGNRGLDELVVTAGEPESGQSGDSSLESRPGEWPGDQRGSVEGLDCCRGGSSSALTLDEGLHVFPQALWQLWRMVKGATYFLVNAEVEGDELIG